MFALSENDLHGTILGCGDGPASFNAELTARGGRVISFDPIYTLPAAEITRRVEQTYDPIIDQVKRNPDAYVWDEFQDPDGLGEHRLATMLRFLADYESG